MALNQRKLNVLLASIAILGACMSTGITQAGEPPTGEVTTKTPATSAEDSATAWDKTKEGSAEAWDKTKEVSGDVWDATKEGSAKAWDKTKEVSGDAWDATKEGSAKAWDKTNTTVQGWQETKPESETDSNQETPAPS
jgi:hypothetical protein